MALPTASLHLKWMMHTCLFIGKTLHGAHRKFALILDTVSPGRGWGMHTGTAAAMPTPETSTGQTCSPARSRASPLEVPGSPKEPASVRSSQAVRRGKPDLHMKYVTIN